jgi:pimeloyl-ACP methyl ester carboxylesterase
MPLVEVAGRKVYYEVHGDAPGPPLLLLASLGGSCSGWLPLQIPDFSRGRRCVIFEHRGVGKSEDPGGAFSIADLADDAVGLLDALAIERSDVLGVFLGGMVAQEMALRHPRRVERLVLVGTFARPDAKRRLLLEKWREQARSGIPEEVLVRERLLWTLQDETLEQGDLIDAMVDFFRKSGAPLSPEMWMRQCEACLRHDTEDHLHAIRAATLVVCGRYDQLTPPKFHRMLADGIPCARLVTLPYGAHLVMAESAQRFNHVVSQFLDEGR